MELKLKAEERKVTGKGPVRRLRSQGEVPAVLYGQGTEAFPLKIKADDLREVLHSSAGSNVLIDMQVARGKEKENHLVMIKEIQRHPFKSRLLHIDFVKVSRDEKVTTKVPIAITGEDVAAGLKAGGTLQHNLWEVEVECLPADMPDHVFADVSQLEIGDHLTVADLKGASGVTILTDTEDTILTILAPRIIEVEEVEVAEVLEEEAAAKEEVAPEEEKPGEATPGEGGEAG